MTKVKKAGQHQNIFFRGLLAMAGISMAVALMLAGCGGQDGHSGQSGENTGSQTVSGVRIVEPENPVRYATAFTDLDIPGDASLISNQWPVVYGMTMDPETGEEHFFRKDMDSDEPSTEFVPSVRDIQTVKKEVLRFSSDEEGSLYIIWSIEVEEGEEWKAGGEGGTHYFLCKYAGDGQELVQKKIEEPEVCAEIYRINNIVTDDEGRLYLFGRSHIFLYDSDWEYQGEVAGLEGETGTVNICVSGKGRDGKVYYTRRLSAASSGEWELAEVDFAGKKTGTVYKGFLEITEGKSSLYLVPGVGHDFLISDGEFLYGYLIESQTTERILKWADLDVSGSSLLHFCGLENGDILAIEKMAGLQLVRLSEPDGEAIDETEGKEIITLGITADWVRDDLKNKIAQFNRMQDIYQVEMKVYGDASLVYNNISQTGWSEEGMRAITLELVSGKGPDLIAYNGYFPVYAEKGMLEDLNGYLEKSEVLSREDYLETVLDVFTFHDTLVALPTYFSLETIYGYTDQVGEERGLSLEQFLEVVGKYEDIPPFDTDAINTMIRLLEGSVMTFIDMDNKICHFDSEGFQDLLKFIRNAPVVEWQGDGWYDPELGSDYLLAISFPHGLGSIIPIRASKRPVTLIGYPTEEGDGTYLYAYNNWGCTGIASNSQHKEGAWAFLEYLYSTLYDIDENRMPAFPARLSRLEEIMNEKVGTTQKVNGEEYTITEEDVEYTMELIRHATPNGVNLYANTICDIIFEEAMAYLAGDKSVEEVTDVIQNRVQLFLNEQF